MYALVIDMAYSRGIVGIVQQGEVIAEVALQEDRQNSTLLAQVVDSLLKEKNVSPKEIQEIVVGVGPGSYTGIRVAVSFAAGLAAPLGVPLIPVCSLAGFLEKGDEVVLADAKMGGIYSYFSGKAELLATNALESFSSSEKKVLIVGNEHFFSKVHEQLKNRAAIQQVQTPSSYKLFHYAEREKPAMAPLVPELLYLRASQAEIERGDQRGC